MKHYKNLGIAALIIFAVTILMLLSVFFSGASALIIPVASFLFLACLVLSIISIVGMRKRHEKGLWIPITVSVLSFIGMAISGYFGIFMIMMLFAFMPETVYTYEVPMTITVNTYNPDLSPVGNADSADLFIFMHPKEDVFPEECSPEFFQLRGLRSPNLIYFEKNSTYSSKAPEGYREPYRGTYKTFPLDIVKDEPSGEQGITFTLGEKASRTYLLELNEKDNNPGASKKSLQLKSEEFYIRYSYLPLMTEPGKELAINTTGCYPSSNPYSEGILEINGVSGKQARHEEQIVCVKQFHIYEPYPSKYDLDDCSFYKISYEIEVEYYIDLTKGEKKKTVVYPHI